jgi:hypothetical protein
MAGMISTTFMAGMMTAAKLSPSWEDRYWDGLS